MATLNVAHVSIPTNNSGQTVSLNSDCPIKAAVAGRISPVAAECGAALDLIGRSERIPPRADPG